MIKVLQEHDVLGPQRLSTKLRSHRDAHHAPRHKKLPI